MMQIALTRPRYDRHIAGVCSGLACFLGWEVRKVRIAYFFLTLLAASFPGILLYLVLWYLMPLDDQSELRDKLNM